MKKDVVEESVDMVETVLSNFLSSTELIVNTISSEELYLDPDTVQEIKVTASQLISLLDTYMNELDDDVDVNIDDEYDVNITDELEPVDYTDDNQYSQSLNYMKQCVQNEKTELKSTIKECIIEEGLFSKKLDGTHIKGTFTDSGKGKELIAYKGLLEQLM